MIVKIVALSQRLLLCAALFVVAAGLALVPAAGQTSATADQSGGQTQAQSKLREGQIEQLVAPIALYPGALLSRVLSLCETGIGGESARGGADVPRRERWQTMG